MKFSCDVFINNYICMREILTTDSTLILLQYQPVNSLTIEAYWGLSSLMKKEYISSSFQTCC